MIKYTIQAYNSTLLDYLFNLLGANLGEVIEIASQDDGSISIKKEDKDRKEALETFRYVAKQMTEDRVLEKAGLKTEQDVADFINELRDLESRE